METVFVTVQKPHALRYEGAAKLSDAADFDRCHRIGITGSMSRDFEGPKEQPTACIASTVLSGTVENQTGYVIFTPLLETIRSTVLIATGAEPYLHFISIRHCALNDSEFFKGSTVIEPFSHIIGAEGAAAGSPNRQ